MKFKPKYVAAASCIIIMVVIASTAGCTSSSTSSNQQASQAASGGQAASGYPADITACCDPDPSVMPRYNPSQRTDYADYPDRGSTSYGYDTRDTMSQVSSFYQTQMPKLGYTVKIDADRPDYSLIKYQKNGKTVVGMMLQPISNAKHSSAYLSGNYTTIGVVVNGPNSDYSTVTGA